MKSPLVLIEADVLEGIKAEAARYGGKKERGGIFLGFRRDPHLHVFEATLPMPRDFATMFSFKRRVYGHQRVALKRWRETEHTMDWIGEWHSHPERHPSPSSVDLRSWRGMTAERNAPMVYLIVGYQSVWVGLSLPTADGPVVYSEIERSAAGHTYAPNNSR